MNPMDGFIVDKTHIYQQIKILILAKYIKKPYQFDMTFNLQNDDF